MFLKIKNRIINTDHLVDAKYEPAHEWEDDEYDPPRKVNSPSSLTLTMTSSSGQEVTGFDGDVLAAYSESDAIVLSGPEADDVWGYLVFDALDCEKSPKENRLLTVIGPVLPEGTQPTVNLKGIAS